MPRVCTIPQPLPRGWGQAQVRDEYFRALADYEECQAKVAQLGPRASRHELYELEKRLRAIQGLLKGEQLDTLPYIPGSRAQREEKLLMMSGMG